MQQEKCFGAACLFRAFSEAVMGGVAVLFSQFQKKQRMGRFEQKMRSGAGSRIRGFIG